LTPADLISGSCRTGAWHDGITSLEPHPIATSMPESGILERQQRIVSVAPSATQDVPLSPAQPQSRPVVTARTRQAAAVVAFSAASLSVIWFSLGDHALHSHSEGRYACVAEAMADGGSWLVPQLEGRPHLTKPPLTYWLEALSLRCFGHNEFAVRLPSAAAGSVTALALLAVGWRLGGPKRGVLAMGILMLTPLHVTMSRLTLTDSLMGLFWFGILAGGYLCLAGVGRAEFNFPRDDRNSPSDPDGKLNSGHPAPSPLWPCILLWASFALGMLTKAPLSFVPLGVLVVWAVITGRRRDLRRLHPAWGLPLAMLPFAAWAALIVRVEPTAAGLWYTETIGRALGTGDHSKPFWFYLPVFFVALFPATAIIRIPGWHLSWRAAWRSIRDGGPETLWVLSVVLPLLFFSASRGKHFSYILPLAPPLALLSAGLLKQLLDRPPGAAGPFGRGNPAPPLIVFLACLATVAALAVTTWLYASGEFPLHWLWTPVLMLTAAAGWQWHIWDRRPAARCPALIAVWTASLAVWFTASEVEDVHFDAFSTRRLVERIRRHTGVNDPDVHTFGHADSTIAFYTHSALSSRGDGLGRADAIAAQARVRPTVLIADPKVWKHYAKANPRFAKLFPEHWDWDRGRWKGRRVVLFSRPQTSRHTPSAVRGRLAE
jgi:4-amino-4-deoxy-L-arabinose transferase-like glycosyltransferase